MATNSNDKTAANYSDDETAVRELYQQMMDGWNHCSGDAFAAVFTREGHLVGFDGTHFEGREKIASFHQELFDKWLNGTRLIGQITNVQFLSADVAVIHALGRTIPRGKSKPTPERDSIQTLVAKKKENEWRFVAFQNTRRRPIGRDFVSILLWKMSDWLWKVARRGE